MLDWATTLSLVFGGCCSNAITLEQFTSTHPHAGSLLTFLQFLVVSLYGLSQHLIWTSYGPRLKPRTVPLLPYLSQAGLLCLLSLLNNAAFAYRIPMSVHIIFRSGGLIVSMVLGWALGKKYTWTQVASVVLVTIGVALTTLSASRPASSSSAAARPRSVDTDSSYSYTTGIGMLSLALLLSGLLGLVQERTQSTYTRSPSPVANGLNNNNKKNGLATKAVEPSAKWQEAMFYVHFLSLPMFLPVRGGISSQLRAIHSPSSPRLSFPLAFNMTAIIPAAYIPLLLNTFTQLVCVAGVNRLTTRVSALTVTLVLVVRKAASLVLSMVGDGFVVKHAARVITRESPRPRNVHVDARMMWTGAAMVMLGTIGYSLGSVRRQAGKGKQL